jgi:hypothetical protein
LARCRDTSKTGLGGGGGTEGGEFTVDVLLSVEGTARLEIKTTMEGPRSLWVSQQQVLPTYRYSNDDDDDDDEDDLRN